MRYCKLFTLWICIVSTSKLIITNNFVALHALQTYWVTYSFSMNLIKICFGKWDGLIIKTVLRAKRGGSALVLLCHQWELIWSLVGWKAECSQSTFLTWGNGWDSESEIIFVILGASGGFAGRFISRQLRPAHWAPVSVYTAFLCWAFLHQRVVTYT